jgi:hypothetical protein
MYNQVAPIYFAHKSVELPKKLVVFYPHMKFTTATSKVNLWGSEKLKTPQVQHLLF